jgi:hypothetical protein
LYTSVITVSRRLDFLSDKRYSLIVDSRTHLHDVMELLCWLQLVVVKQCALLSPGEGGSQDRPWARAPEWQVCMDRYTEQRKKDQIHLGE